MCIEINVTAMDEPLPDLIGGCDAMLTTPDLLNYNHAPTRWPNKDMEASSPIKVSLSNKDVLSNEEQPVHSLFALGVTSLWCCSADGGQEVISTLESL